MAKIKQKVVALHMKSDGGGIGTQAKYSLRSKVDHCEFEEFEHQINIAIHPPRTLPMDKQVVQYLAVSKSALRYWEYETPEESEKRGPALSSDLVGSSR